MSKDISFFGTSSFLLLRKGILRTFRRKSDYLSWYIHVSSVRKRSLTLTWVSRPWLPPHVKAMETLLLGRMQEHCILTFLL